MIRKNTELQIKLAKGVLNEISPHPMLSTVIFSFGGSGVPGELASKFSSVKNVHHISSVNEEGVSLLRNGLVHYDIGDYTDSVNWVFISRSGKTPEVLFYLDLIKKLFFERGMKLRNSKIFAITKDRNSPLAKEAGTVYGEWSDLPGRFSFFSLGGLVQFGLYGFDLDEFCSMGGVAYSNSIERFFMETKGRLYLTSDNKLSPLAKWFAGAWSESLHKGRRRPYPIRYLEFDDVLHSHLEEIQTHGITGNCSVVHLQGCYYPKNDCSEWNEERYLKANKYLEKKGVRCLFLPFMGEKEALLKSCLRLLMEIIIKKGNDMGLKEWEIMGQPAVDEFKAFSLASRSS